MITKKTFERACGGVFVTRKKLAEVLHYKDPHSVDKYLNGLERICGSRYLTEDVYDRIVGEGLHK